MSSRVPLQLGWRSCKEIEFSNLCGNFGTCLFIELHLLMHVIVDRIWNWYIAVRDCKSLSSKKTCIRSKTYTEKRQEELCFALKYANWLDTETFYCLYFNSPHVMNGLRLQSKPAKFKLRMQSTCTISKEASPFDFEVTIWNVWPTSVPPVIEHLYSCLKKLFYR